MDKSPEKSSPVRRTNRKTRPSLKALESIYRYKAVSEDESSEEPTYYSSDEDFDGTLEKPKQLHENEIVTGQNIFSFQTKAQKNALANKVMETCNYSQKLPEQNRMKSKIAKKILEENSDSDYIYSSNEESSSSENDSENAEESNDDKPVRKVKFDMKKSMGQLVKGKGKVGTYTINTEEFFSNSGGSKIKTSNNTLDKLETPRLSHAEIQELLQKKHISKSHIESINNLKINNEMNFNKWMYLLHENYNILLFGLGSKKKLLSTFQEKCLGNSPVIVVNGFFPTLNIKNLLDTIIVDLLECKENTSNLFEACEIIQDQFQQIPESHLYLIIHNIEGEVLRNARAQNVLARLATIRNIHLIASIDHINAPLIWDHNKLNKFNYIWWDVTSFNPYIEETSFEKSMMVQKTGGLVLSSLKNVFLSLTTNSKNVYLIIVKYQLEHGNSKYYQGISFKDLYLACREAFIVSSDLALRAQLTEFIDHKMIKVKRSVDGVERLIIPLANPLLQKFLDEQ